MGSNSIQEGNNSTGVLPDDYDTAVTAPLDDPSYGKTARRDFWAVMGFGLFALQLNFWCSSYVIYRKYQS